MKKKHADCLFGLVMFCCFACIGILELTKWRPLGTANNATGINNLLLMLSYSMGATFIFYVLHDKLPMLYRKRIAEAHVKREMRQLREQLRLCTFSLYPFNFTSITDMPKEEFMNIVGRKNLNQPFLGGSSKTILEQLNNYRKKIIEISESLMSSYYATMRDEQIEVVSEILNSFFVANGITPINYELSEEYRDSYFNNQWEVCESIYDEYIKIVRLIAKEEKNETSALHNSIYS